MNKLLRHLPNGLSAFRLIAAPFAALFILEARHQEALLTFVLAGASDALDGWLAKAFSLRSRFGALLDPAADKLLMLLCFIALAAVGATPLWLAAAVIGRDVCIVAGVLAAKLANAPLKLEPLIVGKVSTVVQVGYVVLLLVSRAAAWQIPPPLVVAAELSVAVLAAWSLVAYLGVWLRAMEQLVRARS